MYKTRQTIWCVIHAERTSLKIWPHLTFGWHFTYISSTIHKHRTNYIFVILTSNLTHINACFNDFLNLTPNSIMRNPYWGGVKSLKILPKHTPTNNDCKLTKNSFLPKCYTGTSLTVRNKLLTLWNKICAGIPWNSCS